mgnify:CR=1 FL=1
MSIQTDLAGEEADESQTERPFAQTLQGFPLMFWELEPDTPFSEIHAEAVRRGLVDPRGDRR